MIRQTGIIILALLTTVSVLQANGQDFVPTPVEISTEIVNIQGKTFYAHKVLKGQTLYSISKAYNVSVDELKKANPSLNEGLKAGSIINIPAPDGQFTREVVVATISENVANDTITPKKEAEVQKVKVAKKDKKYKKHTVKWYENIYDVAQKHKVPVDALIEFNELGENTVLKKRQILFIPDKEYITDFNRAKKDELNTTPKNQDLPLFPQDSTATEPGDSASNDTFDYSLYDITEKRSYKVSLVLPFEGNNQMDLYAGALIAFKEFQESNPHRKYTLNVVNLNEYKSTTSLLASGRLDESEFIIGPILEKEIKPIAAWAKENNIPLISPLDPKASYITQENPFFIQFPPIQENLIESTYEGVIEDGVKNGDKPLIIYEKWTRHSKLVTGAINSITGKGVQIDTLGYGILEGRGIDMVMVEKLDTTNVNTVFVVSESEAFVSDVLRNLLLAKGQNSKIEISLYGLPKWRNFEIIELSYFHDLNTHLSLQYFINYEEPKTKQFVTEFRYNFDTDPTQYAFQGYDIMSYFISVLDTYGKRFPVYLPRYSKSLLQSNVRLEKAPNHLGFTNSGVKNIHYSGNWSIKPW